MLLTALRELAERHPASGRDAGLPPFYVCQRVAYAINLDRNGTLLSFDALRGPENGPRGARGLEIAIPYVKRTSGARALPIDKGDYVLGIGEPLTPDELADADLDSSDYVLGIGKPRKRTVTRHALYRDLVSDAARQTSLGSLGALEAFLASLDLSRLPFPEDYDPGGFIAVYVDGELVVSEPALARWWARTLSSGDAAGKGYCGVCGQLGRMVESSPVSIRGLVQIGGKADMALVSANSDVFEHFGLQRATSASLCIDCANATHQALNGLIASPTNSKKLGQTLFVWWASEDVADLVIALIKGDDDAAVYDILDALDTGALPASTPLARFYGASLGASGSRVVVRSWVDVTIDELEESIRQWFRRLTVVGHDGERARRYGIWSLGASLSPPGQGDALSRLPPAIPKALLESALFGRRLPPIVLTQALRRVQAQGGHVSAPIASLLKAALTPPDHPNPEAHMRELDLSSDDTPYLSGRLLALLDETARLATIPLVDRSYVAASTMPQATFVRLLRLHRAHLDKLHRDRPGAAARLDRQISEVLVGIDRWPAMFSLEGQARFALGLYHQQAAGRQAARDAKQASSSTVTAEDNDDNPEQELP